MSVRVIDMQEARARLRGGPTECRHHLTDPETRRTRAKEGGVWYCQSCRLPLPADLQRAVEDQIARAKS